MVKMKTKKVSFLYKSSRVFPNLYEVGNVANKSSHKKEQNIFSKKLPLLGIEPRTLPDCTNLTFSCQSESLRPSKSHAILFLEMIQIQKVKGCIKISKLIHFYSGQHSWVSMRVDHKRFCIQSQLEAIFFAEFVLLFLA